jgi:hypothetical protein
MNTSPRKLNLDEWDDRYEQLRRDGLREAGYGGPLRRHVVREKDFRLQQLQFDNSPAALRLWNFLLTENERLHQARANGHKIVGTMKDLGTVPVMAYALPGVRAFYPDGAWWTPCLMECSDKLLQQAEAMGIDASFCPVRAMLPAFENGEHFPQPDLLVCSTGAVCDDFSAIAQRLEHLGHPIFWWEIPRRRQPAPGEMACALPGNLAPPKIQVDCVRTELQRIGNALADPMVGPTSDRATRIVRECQAGHAEAVVVSRIPGASHCAREGEIIREIVRQTIGILAIELEIPPVCDALLPSLGSRLQALVETARDRRTK